jgi:hypothetical protein
MLRKPDVERFAEREVEGRDDRGDVELVTIWMDYRKGGIWSVGRAINLERRETRTPRPEDEIFAGYELADALQVANDALESDLDASEDNDDHNAGVRPFTAGELKSKLERWFFTHASRREDPQVRPR